MKKSKIMVIVSIFVIFVFACLYWVNTPYRDARTLVAAIRNEDTEKVEELLQHGVDPNVLTASKLGSKLLGFVEMGPDRPLSEACRMGNIDIVKALIGHGATAEPMDGTGWSPLDETLFFYQPNDIEIVRLLLKNGADPMHDNQYYGLPVFMAAEMIPQDYNFNRKGSRDNWVLPGYSEVAAKGISELTILLLGDQSVDIQNANGETLLILAVQQSNLYLVEQLLLRGCNPDIADNNGKTAINYATEAGNAFMIALLGTRRGQGDG